jgi:aryl-alcohol dehydrogenase-like predicted oxidoreductase
MTDISYRPLGKSGLIVSTVGLGCNNFGRPKTHTVTQDATTEVIDAAIEAGITLFDTADIYGGERGLSETLMGHALKGRRDQIVLATKFGMDMQGANGPDWGARGSRRYIRRAVESSLRRLRTDWIDLYQLHRPDPLTPIEETLGALTELVREGKVRYLGSSNFSGFQTADAEWTARTRGLERFISAQNEYSWLERGIEADLLPSLEHYGIGLLPFFPLASGLLTGKYRRGEPPPEGSRIQAWGRESALTDETFDVLDALTAFAQTRGLTLLDVAIGGLAGKPTVASVIAGATSAAQVKANVAAGAWTPSADELVELNAITA